MAQIPFLYDFTNTMNNIQFRELVHPTVDTNLFTHDSYWNHDNSHGSPSYTTAPFIKADGTGLALGNGYGTDVGNSAQVHYHENDSGWNLSTLVDSHPAGLPPLLAYVMELEVVTDPSSGAAVLQFGACGPDAVSGGIGGTDHGVGAYIGSNSEYARWHDNAEAANSGGDHEGTGPIIFVGQPAYTMDGADDDAGATFWKNNGQKSNAWASRTHGVQADGANVPFFILDDTETGMQVLIKRVFAIQLGDLDARLVQSNLLPVDPSTYEELQANSNSIAYPTLPTWQNGDLGTYFLVTGSFDAAGAHPVNHIVTEPSGFTKHYENKVNGRVAGTIHTKSADGTETGSVSYEVTADDAQHHSLLQYFGGYKPQPNYSDTLSFTGSAGSRPSTDDWETPVESQPRTVDFTDYTEAGQDVTLDGNGNLLFWGNAPTGGWNDYAILPMHRRFTSNKGEVLFSFRKVADSGGLADDGGFCFWMHGHNNGWDQHHSLSSIRVDWNLNTDQYQVRERQSFSAGDGLLLTSHNMGTAIDTYEGNDGTFDYGPKVWARIAWNHDEGPSHVKVRTWYDGNSEPGTWDVEVDSDVGSGTGKEYYGTPGFGFRQRRNQQGIRVESFEITVEPFTFGGPNLDVVTPAFYVHEAMSIAVFTGIYESNNMTANNLDGEGWNTMRDGDSGFFQVAYKVLSPGFHALGTVRHSDVASFEWSAVNVFTLNDLPKVVTPDPVSGTMYVGDTELVAAYLGDTSISKIYLGDTQVFPAT